MAIARDDNNTDTTAKTYIPHGLQDLLALTQVSTPGILSIHVPVLGEGHAEGDNLPFDATWLRPSQVRQEIIELLMSKDGFFGIRSRQSTR
jgi:hypothetical protein